MACANTANTVEEEKMAEEETGEAGTGSPESTNLTTDRSFQVPM